MERSRILELLERGCLRARRRVGGRRDWRRNNRRQRERWGRLRGREMRRVHTCCDPGQCRAQSVRRRVKRTSRLSRELRRESRSRSLGFHRRGEEACASGERQRRRWWWRGHSRRGRRSVRSEPSGSARYSCRRATSLARPQGRQYESIDSRAPRFLLCRTDRG